VNRSRIIRFLVRVGAMAWKESLHIQRDPRTLILTLIMPVLLLMLFGFGISFDLDHIPLAIADRDGSIESRALVNALIASGDFERGADVQPEAGERMLRRDRALGVLVIQPGFGRHLIRREVADVELLVDGADANAANTVLQKAQAIAATYGAGIVQRLLPATNAPIDVRTWTRYNPEARSAVFLVPGLSAFLLALGAVLLTALTIAAEWETGSMEQLFASPVGRFEIVLGKLLPYLALGVCQLLLVVALGSTVFDVPIRGSLWLLFGFGVVFLVGMLGQGLFISVLAKNQMVATQAGLLSSLLPSLLFSGMLFPIANMPRVFQWISAAIPARYLVHAMRGILLKGNGFDHLWPSFIPMIVFAMAVLVLTTARFKRRIV
jgi:ABC-2 type transport system permease protein